MLGTYSVGPIAPGISFKTQVLYVVVFVTRYLDLFLGEWVSLYNTVMKLFFIGSSAYILFLMKVRFK
jgi:ER lumen protein retaining receptor